MARKHAAAGKPTCEKTQMGAGCPIRNPNWTSRPSSEECQMCNACSESEDTDGGGAPHHQPHWTSSPSSKECHVCNVCNKQASLNLSTIFTLRPSPRQHQWGCVPIEAKGHAIDMLGGDATAECDVTYAGAHARPPPTHDKCRRMHMTRKQPFAHNKQTHPQGASEVCCGCETV